MNIVRTFSQKLSRLPIQTYAILDIETTGLKFETDRITEIAVLAVTRDDFINSLANNCNLPRVVSKISMAINPGVPIAAHVTELTGLKQAHLLKHGNFISAFSAISLFLDHLPSPICLISHYGRRFDFPFIKNEVTRYNRKLSEKLLHLDTYDLIPLIDKEWITIKTAQNVVQVGAKCVGSLARPIISRYKDLPLSYKLSDIHQRLFDRAPRTAHSAEGDCIALLDILLFYGMDFVKSADLLALPSETI